MIIAITGGIGSGKSVVSRVLTHMDYPVYDCDAEAKRLMHTSPHVRALLVEQFGAETFSDGVLNTQHLSAVAFSSPEALARLNAIVHPAVKQDMLVWAERQGGAAFVETAIPYSSGLDKAVDAIWRVTAPVELRIARVMARNGLAREQVEARIASQRAEEEVRRAEVILLNDGTTALVPQIIDKLQLLK
ncbi:MAG: dephospho-CoA kinase [Bacteroidales bacterium]|nr:dephospho-CoA kinase [Bacteroidales bacterium]